MAHEDRHVVFNVVGDASMRIEIGPTLHLAARDTVLIASDGLSDNMATPQVVEYMRKGPLASSATRVCQLASQQMMQTELQPFNL